MSHRTSHKPEMAGQASSLPTGLPTPDGIAGGTPGPAGWKPALLWQRRGFSGTDLLVVLAIVSVLAAVVVPMIARARSKTRLQQCISNLQQVNRAVLLYAEDNKGIVPLLQSSPQPGSWWHYKEKVKGYLGYSGPPSPSEKVFGCPSDRGYGEGGEKLVPFRTSKKYNYTSYNLNSITLPGVPNIAGWQVSAVKEPSRTLLTMEWTAHAPLSWHRSRTGKANAPFYNDAESVVGFVDGHVGLIPIYYDGVNAAFTRNPIPGYSYKYSGD
jgi:type II secretory pathway pseudopilin PulG